jgi:hypothetical protein
MTVELSKKIKINVKKCTYYTFKKVVSQQTQRPLFSIPQKMYTVRLVRDTLNPKSKSKGKNGTRFARVFSKAKAHDSQH